VGLVFQGAMPIFALLFEEKTALKMKKDIHPGYQDVIFHDTSSDTKFLTKSTASSKEKATWEDGKEYPVIKVEVSSASHPFFTGKKLFVDTAGRVEKFQKKYGKKPQA
jgi:large subunit ribosomal protein L31